MQAPVVALLIWVRLLYPSVVSPPEHTFRSVQLVSTPVPVNHQPQPVRHLRSPIWSPNSIRLRVSCVFPHRSQKLL